MKPAKMTKTRKQDCPVCGLSLNAASDPLNDCSPTPGDITICASCRTILAFCEAMDLRLATQEEINQVENELKQIIMKLEYKTYTLLNTPNGSGILCHHCGNGSSNPHDVQNRYCGHCHRFLDD
jgi:hypothetical protein